MTKKDVGPGDGARFVADQRARVVRRAVGWLLGPELIGQLKKILRERSDPRDWMPYFRGCIHDECWEHRGQLTKIVDDEAEPEASVAPAPAERAQGQHPAAQNAQGAERVIGVEMPSGMPITGEVWFDYAADMGDAVDSMYAVAYATTVSFGTKGKLVHATWDAAAEPKSLVPWKVELGQAGTPAEAAAWEAQNDLERTLPRGQFLFVGGDTAYHVADAATLASRVAEPFKWAFHDAQFRGHVPKRASADDRTRRLYGIPGNHDWYDNLEGFSLVFRLGNPSASTKRKRAPTAADDEPQKWWTWKRKQQDHDPIQLPELERVQLASYCAIQLPYGWQLWGLDLDSPMDRRQREYFRSLGDGPPDRLIVATPSPAIVFGRSIPDEEHHEAPLAKLGIDVPKLPLVADAVKPKYRLDLSGDVHHYARYFPNQDVKTYGSVVSGLGGAFHHPSFTKASRNDDEAEAVKLYPTPDQSLEDIGNHLLHPYSTWYGSWARAIPLILTVLVGFATLYAPGTNWLVHQLLSLLPGYTGAPSLGGSDGDLLHAGCALSVFVLAAAGVWLALLQARRVFEAQVKDASVGQNIVDVFKAPTFSLGKLIDPRRSYWFAWLIAIVLTSPFLLYPLWGPASSGLDVATIVIALLVIAGGIVGWTLGGKHVRRGLKARIAVVGALHAVAHIITAIVFANIFTAGWEPAVAAIGGLAIAVLPLWLVRGLFKSKRRWCVALLAGCAAICFVLAMAAIIVVARGEYLHAGAWWSNAMRVIGGGLAAMLFGTTWFIWYLAICGRLDGHNNEVGGAARVTKYRQMIRFCVHRAGLTGYVIAIENDPKSKSTAANAGGTNLVYKLIDVFTIAVPATERIADVTPLVNDIDVPS